MGLLLLTLTISGFALHAWLFIEIQLNVVTFSGIAFHKLTFVKLDKIVNPIKNIFLTNLNIFIYTVIFFHYIFMNVNNIISISSIIIYTKIINIPIKPCFFRLSVDQFLEMFPRHNGGVTISESFALNL